MPRGYQCDWDSRTIHVLLRRLSGREIAATGDRRASMRDATPTPMGERGTDGERERGEDPDAGRD